MELSMKDRALRLLAHQSWLRGRDRIIRAFSHPDHQSSHPFEVDFYGLSYAGDLKNFIDWSVFYYGAFAGHELELLSLLAKAIRAQGKPVHFFDVGANIGHHSLFMSQYADRVFSFEPFSVVQDEMIRKLKHARIENVTSFLVALGDENKMSFFRPPTGANQGTGTLGSMLPENASTETIQVPVARADDFFAANQLPSVSLLKMDVEGYEIKALSGMQETLRRDRPPILMEIQKPQKNSREPSNRARVEDLLYTDHLLFGVSQSRGKLMLKPFASANTEEALVLPAELAGMISGTALH